MLVVSVGKMSIVYFYVKHDSNYEIQVDGTFSTENEYVFLSVVTN